MRLEPCAIHCAALQAPSRVEFAELQTLFKLDLVCPERAVDSVNFLIDGADWHPLKHVERKVLVPFEFFGRSPVVSLW